MISLMGGSPSLAASWLFWCCSRSWFTPNKPRIWFKLCTFRFSTTKPLLTPSKSLTSLDFIDKLALVVASEHFLFFLEAVEVLFLLARALWRHHWFLLLLLPGLGLLHLLRRLSILLLRDRPSWSLRAGRLYLPHLSFLFGLEEELVETNECLFAFIGEVAFFIFLIELVKVAGR